MYLGKKKKRTGKKNNQETNEPKGKAKARKEGAQKQKRNPKKKKEKVQTGRPGIFQKVQILTIQKKNKTQG